MLETIDLEEQLDAGKTLIINKHRIFRDDNGFYVVEKHVGDDMYEIYDGFNTPVKAIRIAVFL